MRNSGSALISLSHKLPFINSILRMDNKTRPASCFPRDAVECDVMVGSAGKEVPE